MARLPWLTCIAIAVPISALESQTVALLDTAVLAAPRLGESSGVAASRRHPGVYWTHNDSGDLPYIYATDSAGTDRGRIRVTGAGATDWEDIEVAPCMVSPGYCLYVADSGDNFAQRPHIVVYRLREPDPPAGPSDTLRTTPVLDSFVLRYPDGPRNAEALSITPAGMLLITEKVFAGPPHVYGMNLSDPPPDGRLADLGPLAIDTNPLRGRMVTAGTVSADGRWLVLRTYSSLHVFRVDGPHTYTPVTPPAGILIPVVESQGEGIAFDGQARLVLTSERGGTGHATVARLALTLPDR